MSQKTQLVVIETMQYFEIEIPEDQDPVTYVDSEECRKICAEKIIDQTTELMLERVLSTYNPKTEEWS